MEIRKRLRAWLRDILVNTVVGSAFVPSEIRWLFYRCCGLDMSRCGVEARCVIGGTNLVVGRAVFIGRGAHIDTTGLVSIGSNTAIGPNATILTSSHEIGSHARRCGAHIVGPVCIGEGVWIGSDVTLCPGITIGDGAVIGAGSVVLRDCAPDTVNAGVPAAIVRNIVD